jgi:predicted nucleotidyltransferase
MAALLVAEKQKQAVDQAWQEVRQMAQCLRYEFAVKRILAFGSLARGRFTPDSDIDLAVNHIPPHWYFAAVARANDFIAADIEVELTRCGVERSRH